MRIEKDKQRTEGEGKKSVQCAVGEKGLVGVKWESKREIYYTNRKTGGSTRETESRRISRKEGGEMQRIPLNNWDGHREAWL